MKFSLNIGCGDDIIDNINGYKCVNVDIRPLDKVDIVCDVRNLPFLDSTFVRILASDIIEHFPVSDTDKLLAEWARVLENGGRIKFRTPSLKWVAQTYLNTLDAKFVSWHIFGGQDYKTNFHYVIFDHIWLSKLCSKHGLIMIDYKEVHSNFELVCEKRV